MMALSLVMVMAMVSVYGHCGKCAGDSVGKDSVSHGKANLVALASEGGKFSTLVAAVKAAGLVETLGGPGPFTVFAPTDEAFAKLPEGTLASLLKPENRDQLTAILTYHVLPGKVMASDVKPMQAKTVNGQKVRIDVKDGSVHVDEARVIQTDLLASNGVIHVIDRVILPKS